MISINSMRIHSQFLLAFKSWLLLLMHLHLSPMHTFAHDPLTHRLEHGILGMPFTNQYLETVSIDFRGDSVMKHWYSLATFSFSTTSCLENTDNNSFLIRSFSSHFSKRLCLTCLFSCAHCQLGNPRPQ
jgi:hypothetical protein